MQHGLNHAILDVKRRKGRIIWRRHKKRLERKITASPMPPKNEIFGIVKRKAEKSNVYTIIGSERTIIICAENTNTAKIQSKKTIER